MARKQTAPEKRKSAMRTEGEGVPPRSAVAPRAGREAETRNRDKSKGKQRPRKAK